MIKLVQQIHRLKEAIYDIRDVFINNPNLDKLVIEYFAEEDGGDVNTYFTKVFINDAEYVLQEEEDGWLDNITEIQDGILSEGELTIIQDNILCFLDFSSGEDLNTVTLLRDEIIALNIKNI